LSGGRSVRAFKEAGDDKTICHVGKLKKTDIPEIGAVDEDSRNDQKTKVKSLESWKTSKRKGGIYGI
jgi:hypothetical protein